MLFIFKVTVKTAGSAGPLTGDGNSTTQVTQLWPTATINDTDSLGTKTAIFNNANRPGFAVAKLSAVALKGNAGLVGIGARGTVLASMSQAAAGALAPGSPFGFGDRNDINLADFDVDSAQNGDGWIIFAEQR